MKQFALLTVLTLAVSGAAVAQQTAPTPDAQAPVAKHHAPNSTKEVARMTKQLNLTPDQVSKIEPMVSDRDAQLAAVTSNSALTDDERRDQSKAIRKATMVKMRAVLTSDQQMQMKEMHKHAPAHETESAPAAAAPTT
jgi:protein CpxP